MVTVTALGKVERGKKELGKIGRSRRLMEEQEEGLRARLEGESRSGRRGSRAIGLRRARLRDGSWLWCIESRWTRTSTSKASLVCHVVRFVADGRM
jgi:hypothetical protein